jgi:hypothetical protein
LADIADGKMPTVKRHVSRNRYEQVIRVTDFLDWAKRRGGYGEVIAKLLAEREQRKKGDQEGSAEPPQPVDAAPEPDVDDAPRASKRKVYYGDLVKFLVKKKPQLLDCMTDEEICRDYILDRWHYQSSPTGDTSSAGYRRFVTNAGAGRVDRASWRALNNHLQHLITRKNL